MELNNQIKLNDQESHQIMRANAMDSKIEIFNKIIQMNDRYYIPYNVTLRSTKRNISFPLLRRIIADTLNKWDQKYFASFFTGLNFPRLAYPGGGFSTNDLNHFHIVMLLPKSGNAIEKFEDLYITRFKSIISQQKESYTTGIKPYFWKRNYNPKNNLFYKYIARYESRELESSIDKADFDLSSFGYTCKKGGESEKNFRLIERKFGSLKNSSDEYLSILADIHGIAMSEQDRRMKLKQYLKIGNYSQGTPAYLKEFRRAS